MTQQDKKIINDMIELAQRHEVGTQDKLLAEFAERVHKKALQLMEADGKVEGKHYAAMKLVLKEYGVSVDFEKANTQ